MITKKYSFFNIFRDFQSNQIQKAVQNVIPPGCRVLEIEKKEGEILSKAQPVYGKGIDRSPNLIQQASQNYPGLIFHSSDLGSEYEKLDYILVTTVPKKIDEFRDFCTEIRTICPSSVRLVIIQKLSNLIHETEMEKILESAGFEIIKSKKHFLFLQILYSTVIRPIQNTDSFSKATNLSIIIPALNEFGNIPGLINRIPEMGINTEIIFIEGNSSDNTYEALQAEINKNPDRKCILVRQLGMGKWDAVRTGLDLASGEVIAIFDSDLSVLPEDLPKFIDVLRTNKGEFATGHRMFKKSNTRIMSPLRLIGNRLICIVSSWIIGQKLGDTLCGVKFFWRKDYERFSETLRKFIEDDPFGDLHLLFSAARENLKIVSIPVQYHPRSYGVSKTRVIYHGWMLTKILFEQMLLHKVSRGENDLNS